MADSSLAGASKAADLDSKARVSLSSLPPQALSNTSATLNSESSKRMGARRRSLS